MPGFCHSARLTTERGQFIDIFGGLKLPTTRMIHVILEVGRLTGIIAIVPGLMLQACDTVR